MKPRLLLLLFALTSIAVSAFSQKSKPSETGSKTIRFTEAFTSLIIEDDISVVLVEGKSNEILIKGEERSIKRVVARVDDGRLVISYSQPEAAQSQTMVFVPAGFLTRVNINGKSQLSSASILSNPKLRVIVAGEAKVDLRSIGKVTVEGTDDFDFVRVAR